MSAPVKEGEILAGKYRVERVLGEGGMGVVVAATHLDLDQKVALKFLLPAALEHPEVIERFAREARAVAKIRSQNVVRVIDTGKMDDGTPFMVMEYLEGKDLADLLHENGPLPVSTAVDYILQACEAMAEAHAVGIIHRDLKPPNLFLAKQPDRRAIVKVLDFGISKVVDPASAQLTRTATMMGSPHYMSPEQLTSTKHVDARADIWAMGVILYELVSGVRPYDAETMPEIVARILGNTPEPLTTLRPDVPPALAAAIMRCLETPVAKRFATVADLAEALAPFASDALHTTAAVQRMARLLGPSLRPPSIQEGALQEGALQGASAPSAAQPSRTGLPTAREAAARRADGNDVAHANTQMATSVGAGVGAADAPAARGGRAKLAIGAIAVIALGGIGAFALRARPPIETTAPAVIRPADPPVVPTPPPARAPDPAPSAAPVETQAAPATSAKPVDPHAPKTAKPRAAATQAPAPPPAPTTPPPASNPVKKNPLDMGIK